MMTGPGLSGSPARTRFSHDVAIGADGFLFHRFEQAFEQICGDTVPADRRLAEWVSVIEGNYAWCAAKQVSYVALIVPERHVVYADKLPPGFTVSPARPVARLVAAIDPGMRQAVLYPDAALLSARATQAVFYKTDEHLNLHGSYVCYESLLRHLRRSPALEPLPKSEMDIHQVSATGNLGIRLDDEPVEPMETWQRGVGCKVRRIFRNHKGRGRVEIFEQDDEDLPTAVLLGDSNIDQLCRILACNFSRIVVVYHCHRLFYDLIRSERPDIVIHAMAEVRLGRLSTDGADLTTHDFLDHCGEPMPDPDNLFDIDFGEGGDSRDFTGEGWSYTEKAHTWMVGEKSLLRLPAAVSGMLSMQFEQYSLSLGVRALTISAWNRQKQRLKVFYGDDGDWQELGEFELAGTTRLELPLPHLASRPSPAGGFKFEHPDGFALKEEGLTDETRLLSFAVSRLSILTKPRQGGRD